jgi:hypothetical protein
MTIQHHSKWDILEIDNNTIHKNLFMGALSDNVTRIQQVDQQSWIIFDSRPNGEQSLLVETTNTVSRLLLSYLSAVYALTTSL